MGFTEEFQNEDGKIVEITSVRIDEVIKIYIARNGELTQINLTRIEACRLIDLLEYDLDHR